MMASVEWLIQGAHRLFVPTHIHRKGGKYMLLPMDRVRSTVDGSDCVLYMGKDGVVWCRSKEEFYDGRFKEIECQPTQL